MQHGLGYAVLPEPPDTTDPQIVGSALGSLPIDVDVTGRLVWDTYRYAGLLEGEPEPLDPTSESMARTLGYPFTVLAFAYDALGDRARMLQALERAARLNPDPQLSSVLDQLRLEQLIPADSPSAPADSAPR